MSIPHNTTENTAQAPSMVLDNQPAWPTAEPDSAQPQWPTKEPDSQQPAWPVNEPDKTPVWPTREPDSAPAWPTQEPDRTRSDAKDDARDENWPIIDRDRVNAVADDQNSYRYVDPPTQDFAPVNFPQGPDRRHTYHYETVEDYVLDRRSPEPLPKAGIGAKVMAWATNSKALGKDAETRVGRFAKLLPWAKMLGVAALGVVLKSDMSHLLSDVDVSGAGRHGGSVPHEQPDTSLDKTGGPSVRPSTPESTEPSQPAEAPEPPKPTGSSEPSTPPVPETQPDEPQAPQDQDVPPTEPQPAAEAVPLGEYNSATGEGTLWNAQANFGRSLGEPMNNEQIDTLTQGILDKNGMTREEAVNIQSINGQAYYNGQLIVQLTPQEAHSLLDGIQTPQLQ